MRDLETSRRRRCGVEGGRMPLGLWIAVAAVGWLVVAAVVGLGLAAIFRGVDVPPSAQRRTRPTARRAVRRGRLPAVGAASSVAAASALADQADDQELDRIVRPA